MSTQGHSISLRSAHAPEPHAASTANTPQQIKSANMLENNTQQLKLAHKIPDASICAAHTPPPAAFRPFPKLSASLSSNVHPLAESGPAEQSAPTVVPRC